MFLFWVSRSPGQKARERMREEREAERSGRDPGTLGVLPGVCGLVPGAEKGIGTRHSSDTWLLVAGVLCLEERNHRDRHKDKSREPSRA